MKRPRALFFLLFCAVWMLVFYPTFAGADNSSATKPACLKKAASEMVDKEVILRTDLLSCIIMPADILKIDIQYSCRWPFDPSRSDGLAIFEKKIPKQNAKILQAPNSIIEGYSKEPTPEQLIKNMNEIVDDELKFAATGGKAGRHTLCWDIYIAFLRNHPELFKKESADGTLDDINFALARRAFIEFSTPFIEIQIKGWQWHQEELAEYRRDPQMYIIKISAPTLYAGLPGEKKSSPVFPPPGFQKSSKDVFLKCKAERQDWLENHPDQVLNYLIGEKKIAEKLLAEFNGQKAECESQLQEEKIMQRLKELLTRPEAKDKVRLIPDEVWAKYSTEARRQMLNSGFAPVSSVENFLSSLDQQRRAASFREGIIAEGKERLSEIDEAIVRINRRLQELKEQLDSFKSEKNAPAP